MGCNGNDGAVADSALTHLSTRSIASPSHPPSHYSFTYVCAHGSESGSDHATSTSHMWDGYITMEMLAWQSSFFEWNPKPQLCRSQTFTCCSDLLFLVVLSGLSFFYPSASSTFPIYMSKKPPMMGPSLQTSTTLYHLQLGIEVTSSSNGSAPHKCLYLLNIDTLMQKCKVEFKWLQVCQGVQRSIHVTNLLPSLCWLPHPPPWDPPASTSLGSGISTSGTSSGGAEE